MTQKLRFAYDIVSRAEKPIPTRVLNERLDALREELQGLTDCKLASLDGVAKDLVEERLLQHHNDRVKASVAHCLAMVLQLYGAEQPYDDIQLESIFKLIIKQFGHLANPDGKNYSIIIDLLKLSAECDLFVLLPNDEEFVDLLFGTVYGVISHAQFEPILEPFVVSILDCVIGKSGVDKMTIRSLKLILNKYLANTKVRKGEVSHIPGFDVSLKLCLQNHEKLSIHITKLLSEMLYVVGSNDDLDSDNDLDSDDEKTRISQTDKEKKAQLNKIHTLVIELWRYVPEILTSAMSLLSNELEADDVLIRTVVTKAIGHLLDTQSTLNLTTTHVDVFNGWLKKPLDINSAVRMAWVSQLSKLFDSRSDLQKELQSGLLNTLTDPEENVRLATIHQLSQLKPLVFVNTVASSDEVIKLVKRLVRDKHAEMRQATIKLLATIYDSLIDEEAYDEYKHIISWIPEEILQLVYINNPNIDADVDFIMFEKIIPFETSTEKRVTRLMKVVSNLSSDKSLQPIFAVIVKQFQLSSLLSQVFTLIEEYDFDFKNEELNQKLVKVFNYMSSKFPARFNSVDNFVRFFKLNNKRYYKLLNLCISSSSDYQTVTTALKELLTKVSEPKNLVLEEDDDQQALIDPGLMQHTIKLLLLRASLIWFNIDNISFLTDISKDKSSPYNKTALLLLEKVSKYNPGLLKSNIDTLLETILNGSDEEFRLRDLKTIFNYSKKFTASFYEKVETNDNFLKKMQEMALNGKPSESPYCIQILNGLNSTSQKHMIFNNLFTSIWPLNRNGTDFNTKLAALGEIFECSFITVQAHFDEIFKYLKDEILLTNHTIEENGKEWINEDELDLAENIECRSKLLAIRIFSKWLMTDMQSEEEFANIGTQVIHTFLSNIIIKGGEITKEKNTPDRVQARLRLEAFNQILELATHEKFNELINETILQRLINCVQDEQIEVRSLCVEKLMKLLSSNAISYKFLPLTYFVAHDPNTSLREETKLWIKAEFSKQTPRKKNDLVFEKSWVRFSHMLHNHFELKNLYEDWVDSQSDESFKDLVSFSSAFITFVLNCIASSENVSKLYYLSQRLKQCFDATNASIDKEDPTSNSNKMLYFVSDLSQLVISEVCKLRNWNLDNFNNNLAMPKDLFGTLSKSAALEVSKTDYLTATEEAAMLIRGRWRLENNSNTKNSKRSFVSSVDQPSSKRKRRERTPASEESETVVDSDGDYKGQAKVPVEKLRRSRRAVAAVDYVE